MQVNIANNTISASIGVQNDEGTWTTQFKSPSPEKLPQTAKNSLKQLKKAQFCPYMGINPSNLGVFKSIFPCFETVLAAFYHVLLHVPQLVFNTIWGT